MLIAKLGNRVAKYGKILIQKLGTPKKGTVSVSRNSVSDSCCLTLKQLESDTLQIANKGKMSTKKGTILPIEQTGNTPNLIDKYDVCDSYQYYKGQKLFDIENMRFVDEVNPKILEKRLIATDENVIFISNFDEIKGTIAATTELNKCIATDRMFQCAGLSIVDRSLNKQTLIHVFPKFSVESNETIIKKILEGSRPENLEISIIPGCEYYTEDTVAFLTDITNRLAPNAKINFCNLPAIKHSRPNETEGLVRFFGGKSAIWLKDGKLFCCNNDEIHNKIVNPKEFLTYFG